ncbi:acyltransferase family protein [Pseudomonas aeruginosa]|uniref:acyltransferase family protein n=1 Tax=Pseudomonas aeruginosa TaxID=287 RepID=UPI000CDA0BE5|nr:acyltransferase family protein [Pseudomonas aeruginosa]POP57853.1 acyltransferase [Pseudomonas aeruginosa]
MSSSPNSQAEQKYLIHPKYRPDIDGMRTIAVISVVLYHAFPRWMPGGFIGVDVFFIISGYLISTILYGSLSTNTFRFTEFYARRIKRIFPALILVLVSCYVFGWFTLFADEYKQLGKHIASGSAFISNFILWDESGYFDTSAEVKPLLHLWSLGIEEQFYIIWPFVLWAAWKIRLNLLTMTTAFMALSFSINILNISEYPTYTFFMPHARAWELFLGSILAYLSYNLSEYLSVIRLRIDKIATLVFMRPGTESNGSVLSTFQSIIGISILAFGFYAVNNSEFPGWKAIIPCSGAMLLISAGNTSWVNRNILSSRPFVFIGLISFPLYLWHWPILSFARIIEGDVPSRLIRISAVALSIILAWATYRFIETPLKKSTWNLKTFVISMTMLLVGTSGYLTYILDGIPTRSNVVKAAEVNAQFTGPIWNYATNDVCLKRYGYESAKSYPWWFCMTNKDQNPTVILLGNSYANHLYPGLSTEKDLSKQTFLSIGACDTYLAYSKQPDEPATPCSGNRPKEQLDNVKHIIESTKTVRYIIISGIPKDVSGDYIDRLDETIGYLEGQGVKVIISTPHIREKTDIKSCFSRPLKNSVDCTFGISEKSEIDKAMEPLKSHIKSTHPSVKFFDPNTIFCDGGKCSLVVDGMPMYRDEYMHFSVFASELYAKKFVQWAEKNGIDIAD